MKQAANDDKLNSFSLNTLPHSSEAEQALLGMILRDNEVYHRISHIISGKHFYNPVHTRIFDAITGLIEMGQLADAIVLKTRFSKDKVLEEIGGVEYLALLVANAANSSTADQYAQLILDLSIRRELIRLGESVREAANNTDSEQDAQEQISAAENQLYNLAETGSTQSGFQNFQQALLQSIEMATAAYKRDGGLSGIATGFKDLDQLLGGLHKSDLIILAGRPSMGKTALATNIAFHVTRAYQKETAANGPPRTSNGGIVGFFSLEMSSEQLATRLLAEHSGIASHKIRRGEITAHEYDTLRDSVEVINNIPLYIDDTGGLSIGALATRARRLKRLHGLDLLIVDYLQLLNAHQTLKRSDGRVQEVTIITQRLKTLAKELDVPILALSQLSRQVEQRDRKQPQLSDLRESGSIEQDADVVMFVYREEYYKDRQEPKPDTEEHEIWKKEMEAIHGLAEIIVSKQRHGPIATIKLTFNAQLTQFNNHADDRYSHSPQ